MPVSRYGCGLCGFHLSKQNMNTVPITKRGAELMKEELQRLKTKDRPAVINAISEARAQGDLSENAEYDAAKERQSFIEGRIADLEGKLGAAQIIDPTLLDAEGRIVFASTVHLEDLETGDKVNYQIVGVDEADIKDNKVSVTSPIARALIGKSAGDVVEVQAPSGIREYEVLEVRYV
jgi:transcription elongation factor GreA